ncbi:putative reverse transcriptase domain-containing protein [Tanacetum coccineum]
MSMTIQSSVKDKILATPSETSKKENVVTDALSRKERVKPKQVRAMAMTIQSKVKGMILASQGEAFDQENVMDERLHGLDHQMERKGDMSLYFMDQIWVPLVGGVRTVIMDEAHKSRYFVHPGADKMYYDLRDMYWWSGMKMDIATYVNECLNCAKVKVEHQRPSGLLQQPKIPEWKLTKSAHFLAIREDYNTEKLARLYTDEIVARHGVPVSIISDRDARSPVLWAEIGEGPFEILERIGSVAYRLRLPEELSDVHDTFHVSNLKKCLADASLHVPLNEIKVDKTLRSMEYKAWPPSILGGARQISMKDKETSSNVSDRAHESAGYISGLDS